MIRSAFYLAAVFVLAGCVSTAERPAITTQAAALAIRENYDRNLAALSPGRRGHWALRMYRISGDETRLDAINEYGYTVRDYFIRHTGNLDTPLYAEAQAHQFMQSGPDTAKHRARREALNRDPLFAFRRRVLSLAFVLKSLGLEGGEMAPYYRRAQAWLARESFRPLLENADFIRYDAAVAVNTVYYLKAIGGEDLENVFTRRFREVFPDNAAEEDPIVFENRLYGLTHFVIAASGYYQQFVPAEKFQWILDYFTQNLDIIIARSKPDVLAEAGLSFKLLGLPDHPAVARLKDAVLREFDSQLGVVPPRKSAFDWNRSEHRNILAYMLFTDFNRLYPGPNLLIEERKNVSTASA